MSSEGSKSTRGPSRLYVKGIVQSYTRSTMNQDSGTNILRIQGVADKKATEFYMGKRVAYVYKVTKKTPTSPGFRVIWGRITRPHGTSGAVRAQFRNNLPPKALGGQVRIMLYPSRV